MCVCVCVGEGVGVGVGGWVGGWVGVWGCGGVGVWGWVWVCGGGGGCVGVGGWVGMGVGVCVCVFVRPNTLFWQYAQLEVRITKDAIVLSVRFAAILKRRFFFKLSYLKVRAFFTHLGWGGHL